MKAVILAAGMGTRLGTLIPKPLTSIINEKTVLDFQIEKLSETVGMNNIFIVVGYKKELIMEKFPSLLYIYNHAYIKTNTSKSLLIALEKIDDDVIWLNGDVFFDKSVIDLLIKSSSSACLVDTSVCNDEEIKYNLDESGNIKELSKQVKNGLGEAVGINMVKREDLKIYIEELKKVNNNDYFEKALENLTLANKLQLKPVNINNFFCKEIDFEEDLKQVQEYINKSNK